MSALISRELELKKFEISSVYGGARQVVPSLAVHDEPYSVFQETSAGNMPLLSGLNFFIRSLSFLPSIIHSMKFVIFAYP